VRTYRDKFGFALGDLERLATVVARAPELEWSALMVHVGSQVTRAEPYLEALEHCFAAAARLRARAIEISEINLGGGLPADAMLNLRVARRFRSARLWERLGRLQAPAESSVAMADRLAQKTVALRRRHRIAATLALEPGRSLVAGAGVMLGRVHVVKPPWAFVDVSLNDLPEKLTFAEWRLVLPTHEGEPHERRWHLGGPTLATQDVLFYDHRGPELRCGDPVAILDTGAYSISRASQFTRPRPPVYFVDRQGRARLIRRAETPADVLRTQVSPGTTA